MRRHGWQMSMLLAAGMLAAVNCLAQSRDSRATSVVVKTSLGEIVIELNFAKAPITVANFLRYLDGQYYDGAVFHRSVPGALVQGGKVPEGTPGKRLFPPIKNEAGNGLSNVKGSVAMAGTQKRDSATSEFFINLKDNASFDPNYCVFGKVVAGMEVVGKIETALAPRKSYFGEGAAKPVVIESVRLKHAPPPAAKAKSVALVMKTSLGEIQLELNAAKAPMTVTNFLEYVDARHYDGTIFHRVIPDFMIQGGGLTKEMEPKKTRPPILNEAENGLLNVRGSLAMARKNRIHTATDQFYINLKDNTPLDNRGRTPAVYGYCVFGRVTAGMEAVDKIAAVRTATRGITPNVPIEPVIIESIRRK